MFWTEMLNLPFLLLRLAGGGSFPKPLSAEEEREYVERCAAGDLAARNVLIERNMRLVAHIIKKYYAPDSDQDDLISIGTIGLIKGITSYNPDKGTKLATYVSRCIENEILMHFRARKKTASDVSLSETLDGDEDGNLTLVDVVSVEDDILEEISARELYGQVRGYVENALEPRERRVIELRYGLAGERRRTQRETAEELGISRSYVSRIEKRALQKLRRLLEGNQ